MIENISDSQEKIFKLNIKEAMGLSKVQNVNRKCKSCNKPFALMGILPGQKVICPECGASYLVKYEISFKAVLEGLEA